jgi:hypothetical protein
MEVVRRNTVKDSLDWFFIAFSEFNDFLDPGFLNYLLVQTLSLVSESGNLPNGSRVIFLIGRFQNQAWLENRGLH